MHFLYNFSTVLNYFQESFLPYYFLNFLIFKCSQFMITRFFKALFLVLRFHSLNLCVILSFHVKFKSYIDFHMHFLSFNNTTERSYLSTRVLTSLSVNLGFNRSVQLYWLRFFHTRQIRSWPTPSSILSTTINWSKGHKYVKYSNVTNWLSVLNAKCLPKKIGGEKV